MTGRPFLELRRLYPELELPLADFFRALEEGGVARHFHPHPFDGATAKRLCRYQGNDLYCAATDGQRVYGYGMLRGWDEGYEVPSLGIAIRPGEQGKGLGGLMMAFLHAAARHQGARRIRLKVYPDNTVAVGLYRSLGYTFSGQSEGQLVGVLDL